MEFKLIKVEKPDDVNVILGQAHFIKTAEDLYEALVNSVPGIKFGLAFCEASGPCLVRVEGTDEELKKLAADTAYNIGAGHSFIIFLKNSYPLNVLNSVKSVPEVCSIYCATANSVEVLIVESSGSRGIAGVIDGSSPKAVEKQEDLNKRKGLLRSIGYKL